MLAVGVAFSTPAFFSAIPSGAGPAGRGAASGTASAAIDLWIGGGPILLGLVAALPSTPAIGGLARKVCGAHPPPSPTVPAWATSMC